VDIPETAPTVQVTAIAARFQKAADRELEARGYVPLWRILLRPAFFGRYLAGLALFGGESALIYVSPLLLRLIIQFIQAELLLLRNKILTMNVFVTQLMLSPCHIAPCLSKDISIIGCFSGSLCYIQTSAPFGLVYSPAWPFLPSNSVPLCNTTHDKTTYKRWG
jgi:hypothetical protein